MAFFNFFKKPTLREKLRKIDMEITSIENYLIRISNLHSILCKIIWTSVLVLSMTTFYNVHQNFTQNSDFPFFITSIVSFSLFFSYYANKIVFTFLISRFENQIKIKKIEQTTGIQQLKHDEEYDEMVKIIQKYESDGLKKNKRPSKTTSSSRINSSTVPRQTNDEGNVSYVSSNASMTSKIADKLTNMLLLNNPSEMIALVCRECGEHNGLVFMKQYRPFKCISCKTYNEVEEIDQEEGEEIISRDD